MLRGAGGTTESGELGESASFIWQDIRKMSLGIVRWHYMNSLLRTRASAANENNGMIERVTWNICLRPVRRFCSSQRRTKTVFHRQRVSRRSGTFDRTGR